MASWNEADHPRVPAGDKGAGQFTFKEYMAESAARKAAGMAGLVVGVAWAKKMRSTSRSRRLGYPTIDTYGLTTKDANRKDQEESVETLDRIEKLQQHRMAKVRDYSKIDHTISHAEREDAGFPAGHPLADPKNRVAMLNEAYEALSYSNMVGFGGAIKAASMGNKTDELYQVFSRRMPKGVSLEDLLQAMKAEAAGLLKKNGISRLVLWHGTSSSFGSSTANKGFLPFSLADHYKGISSWAGNKHTASQFGQYLVRAVVPVENILSVPALMPTTIFGMGGVTSLFGGDRAEDEYIVYIP